MKNLKQLDMKLLKKNCDLVILSFGIVALIAYLFYRSVWSILFVFPVGYIFFSFELRERKEKEQKKVALEFREFLNSMISNLQAGYSVENAIREVQKDLIQIFGEQNNMVIAIEDMRNKLKNQISMEECFFEFSKKWDLKEMEDFAVVFAIAKKSGGNLVKIIEQTSTVIQSKMEVERDIHTMLAAKRLGANIMNGVPLFILLYISITNPNFFQCMYGNMKGILFMSVGLVMYCTAYIVSKKILRIKV